MADDRSAFVTLDNCIPIDPIPLINAMNGRVQTRTWRWHCNGRVAMPHMLDNGSILPNGQLDPRNIAMGYDGALALDDGTELAHITQFSITIIPEADTVRPLRSRQTLMRVTGFSVELAFEEFIINDNLLLARVIGPFLDPTNDGDSCDAYLNFQGTVDNRICV
jgi:hypothetical protein